MTVLRAVAIKLPSSMSTRSCQAEAILSFLTWLGDAEGTESIGGVCDFFWLERKTSLVVQRQNYFSTFYFMCSSD